MALMPEFIQDHRRAKLIDRYSRYIKSPVLRLKFLNSAMRMSPSRSPLNWVPYIGSLAERAMLVVELSKVLPPGEPAPFALRVTSLMYRLRFLVYGVSVLVAVSAGTGVVYAAYSLVIGLSLSTEARGTPATEAAGSSAQNVDTVTAIGTQAGISLDKVWLAEQGEGYEFYSNGARVLTQFETEGVERAYYRFGLGSVDAELQSKPIGIVYHLSEGDLLPFADRFNSSLQVRSKSLLQYSRENRLYNYVIDRFGRTYRIVRDEFTANHAGNSLWSDGRHVYVNLSSSFIGICLEGRSESDAATVGPNGINEAQVYAARVLTAVLRSNYAIDDANCVTHGLVSVNPSNKLMGYHTDWVYGFPFEAIGLTNKNDSELLAISRFGFSYDRAYLQPAGGKKWEGLLKAEASLREAVRPKGIPVEEERRSRWQAYQHMYAKQRLLDQTRVSSTGAPADHR